MTWAGIDKKELSLLYFDHRIAPERIEELIRMAWQDIYDFEYDLTFGRWRGIHQSDNGQIRITWENVFGVPFVSSIIPGQDHTSISYCPRDLYEKEGSAGQNNDGG